MYIWGASFERISIIFYDIFIPEQTNTNMESTCFIYKKKIVDDAIYASAL